MWQTLLMERYLTEYPFETRNLTDHAQNLRVLEIATGLMAEGGDDVIELEMRLCSDPNFVSQVSPVFLEALKIAASKRTLSQCTTPFHVSVVWAMYGETSRMKTKAENPHGEDALRAKVTQLKWLFEGLCEAFSWNVVLCDDGCPEAPPSHEYALLIAEKEGYGESVSVITLQDAIDANTPVGEHFSKIKTTADSRKGGSVLLGMWHAIHRKAENFDHSKKHIVFFTDGDLSANLGQIGKLIRPIVEDGKACSAGQRYGLNGAILVKEQGVLTEPISTGTKPDKLIILFRHFVRAMLIPSLSNILDTQAGFKAFDAKVLSEVISEIRSFKETFDVELLIHVAKKSGSEGIEAVPILFTEDFALTNFPSIDPGEGHLNMVKQIVDIYEEHIAECSPAESELLAFIQSLDLEKYVRLINGLRAIDAGDQTLFDRRWTFEQLVAASR